MFSPASEYPNCFVTSIKRSTGQTVFTGPVQANVSGPKNYAMRQLASYLGMSDQVIQKSNPTLILYLDFPGSGDPNASYRPLSDDLVTISGTPGSIQDGVYAVADDVVIPEVDPFGDQVYNSYWQFPLTDLTPQVASENGTTDDRSWTENFD